MDKSAKVKSGGFSVKGGKAKTAKLSGAAPAEPGKVSVGGRGSATKGFSVQGGGRRMAPFTGAATAKPA